MTKNGQKLNQNTVFRANSVQNKLFLLKGKIYHKKNAHK